MIEFKGITKRFGSLEAVAQLTGTIQERNVFGLVGTNGAGKSTFLRMVAGIMKPDEGEIFVDGEPIFENVEMKKNIFYISDDSYFWPNATPREMMRYYAMFYPCYDEQRFSEMMKQFGLDEKRRINTFSKGMKKQASIILGICANTKYLLCDETFDGLDPVMRQAVKSIFAAEIMNRDFTPVIASHNLRELEDFCDHVGLLHRGGMLLSRELGDMKENIFKVQCVLSENARKLFLNSLTVVKQEQRGSLTTFIARGTREEIFGKLQTFEPVFWEILPLTLEEIFISETEVAGYDIKTLLS